MAGANGRTYDDLMSALAERHQELGGEPSLRALGKSLGYSPTTITSWLAGKSFPQDWDSVKHLVLAILDEAERQPALPSRRVDLTDMDAWSEAYGEAARSRNARTSVAMKGVAAGASLASLRVGVAIDRCDPLQLGVNEAIHISSEGSEGLSSLPHWVPRVHDVELAERVVDGGAVALVGTWVSGKSRSAWESVRALDDRWRLWRPGQWSELRRVQPFTVIWLDNVPVDLIEEHAEQLIEVTSDPDRAPVTVLTTLRHEEWTALNETGLRGEKPPYPRGADLLRAKEIGVPDLFAPLDPDDLTVAIEADPRWADASREAGQLMTQYLAGVTALVRVYRHGAVMTRAVIDAAMDARRLGLLDPLSPGFLTAAAPGYPLDGAWLSVVDGWDGDIPLEARRPVMGLPGALRARSRNRSMRADDEGYDLAPYLERLAQLERLTEIPPALFWEAARQHLPPAAQARLALRADGYGLWRLGARLRRASVQGGEPFRAAALLERVPAAGREAERWLARTMPVSDPGEVRKVGHALHSRGADEDRAALYRRAARDVELTASSMTDLLRDLAALNDAKATGIFLDREPGRYLPPQVGLLASLAGLDRRAAEDLAERLVPASPEYRLLNTITWMLQAGFVDAVRSALSQAALPEDSGDFIELLEALLDAGLETQVRRLLEPAGPDRLAPRDLRQALRLVRLLSALGLHDRVAAQISLINADAKLRRWYRSRDEALEGLSDDLLGRLDLEAEPPHQPSSSPPRQSLKLYLSPTSEADDRATSLKGLSADAAMAAVEQADMSDPMAVLTLLRGFTAQNHVAARSSLIARVDPAGFSDGRGAVCAIAEELGPGETARAIMRRVLTECGPWHNKWNRRVVIPALKVIEADDLILAFAKRIADAGNFDVLEFMAPAEFRRFPYGREPDGSPSKPWGWDDLDRPV